MRVLEAEEPVALTDLAIAAGLPKSTASRLLSALERRGLVEQDGERGRLRPGPAILRVAERGMLERNLVEIARPALAALARAAAARRSTSGVPGAVGVEHLLQADGRHFLGAGQWVGRTVDFHCTRQRQGVPRFRARACARWRKRADCARARRRSPTRTRCEPSSQRVRRDGFATAVDELEIGLAAIAAPVRGASGEVVAALSITGPTVRMTPSRIEELWPGAGRGVGPG